MIVMVRHQPGRSKVIRTLLVGLVLLAFAGCGSSDSPDSTDGSAATTVAAFYPLAWVAEQVGADRVEVELLTTPGVEPHDLELSPGQIVAVSDAEVVVLQRGFQPAVDDAVDQGAQGTVVDAAEIVELLPAPEGETGSDPHFWLDPMRMATMAERMAAVYAEADSADADAYAAASDDLVAELERLDADYRDGLADCRTQTVVTSHDAFGYLADRYHLDMLPIAGIDPANEPSPEQLAELVDVVRDKEVTTIFAETLVSPTVAETLADETGLEVATLDPIEGLSDQTTGEDYLSLMRANLAALVRANGC